MTEEELKGKIAELILKGFNKNFKFIELADQILTLIREAGYNKCSVCAMFIEQFGEE